MATVLRPASAEGFLDRLAALDRPPDAPLAVLASATVAFPPIAPSPGPSQRRAEARGWSELIPFDTVDRQSLQDFARWLARLLERKPPMVAASALANKMARGICAMMTRGDDRRGPEIGSAAWSSSAVRTGPPSCEEDLNRMGK
jgi:hypothetical protein